MWKTDSLGYSATTDHYVIQTLCEILTTRYIWNIFVKRKLHGARIRTNAPSHASAKFYPLHQPSDVVNLCWLTKNVVEIRNGRKARSKHAPSQVHPHHVGTMPLIQYANFSPHFTFKCKSRSQNSRKFYSFFLIVICIYSKYMVHPNFYPKKKKLRDAHDIAKCNILVFPNIT